MKSKRYTIITGEWRYSQAPTPTNIRISKIYIGDRDTGGRITSKMEMVKSGEWKGDIVCDGVHLGNMQGNLGDCKWSADIAEQNLMYSLRDKGVKYLTDLRRNQAEEQISKCTKGSH